MQRDIGKYVKRAALPHSGVSQQDEFAHSTHQTGPRRIRKETCHTGILGMLVPRTNEAKPLLSTESNDSSSGGNLFIKRPHSSSVPSQGVMIHSGMASALGNSEIKKQRRQDNQPGSSIAIPHPMNSAWCRPLHTLSSSRQNPMHVAVNNPPTDTILAPRQQPERQRQSNHHHGQAQSEQQHQEQQQQQRHEQRQQKQHIDGQQQLEALQSNASATHTYWGNHPSSISLLPTAREQGRTPPEQHSTTTPSLPSNRPSNLGLNQPKPTPPTFSYPSACSSLPSFTTLPHQQQTNMHNHRQLMQQTKNRLGVESSSGEVIKVTSTVCSPVQSQNSVNALQPGVSNYSSVGGHKASKTATVGRVPTRPSVVVFGASCSSKPRGTGLPRARHVTLYGSSDFNHFEDGGGTWTILGGSGVRMDPQASVELDFATTRSSTNYSVFRKCTEQLQDGSCLGMEDVDGADIGSMGWEGVGTRDN